jgi:uncharacterized protein
MTMNKVRNETAVITGASTGIGAVYADRLAHRGYNLVLTARDVGRMDALAQRLRTETGVRIEVTGADLTRREDVKTIEARLAEGDVTLLVNNAGLSMTGTVIDVDPVEVERLIALNITAPTLLAGAAGKAFVARGSGSIINLASVLALLPEGFDGVYSGSKAYMLNLSQSLAAQYGAKGLYVQAVLPGATRTEIWERSGKDVNAFPPEWVMEVDDLVDASLAGFDRRETVTIPPLADAELPHWEAIQSARTALSGKLSNRAVGERYRETVAA